MKYENIITECSNYISDIIKNETPDIAIILGSGLGDITNIVDIKAEIPYDTIPNFPKSTVVGHAGKLIYGILENKKVLLMSGRFHYYEGYDMSEVTLPIRIFSKLGISNLLVTNAAGGIKDTLEAGSIMLITDHISMFCPSPLRGPNLDEFGPRFKDMTQIYSKDLIALAKNCADKLGIEVENGIYSFFPGPQFESPTEILALRTLGADATGMSTVPEAIVARHCDMRTLGISMITNKAAGLNKDELSHSDVINTANIAGQRMCTLVKQIVKDWNV